MSKEKKKVEDAAEKSREAVGRGVKKGAKAVKDFKKGIRYKRALGLKETKSNFTKKTNSFLLNSKNQWS